MHRFWSRFIAPLIEAAGPRRMMEVGAEFGWNTERLLEYCRRSGCVIDVVDPAPHPALHEVLGRYVPEHRYHPLLSLEAIPLLPAADLVLLDGDHNYFTVYHELQSLFARAVECGVAPPLIIMHDMAWPYARRDMYYDPDPIPFNDRHHFATRGMVPGQSELTDDGLNGHFNNALHEGGPGNGVLTAAEDFVASWPTPVALHRLPFYNGLGILVPAARETAAIQAAIDGFFSAESLLQTCEALETDGMKIRADAASLRLKLLQRDEAVMRLRARVLALEQEAAVRGEG
jgi:hypothetical protein